MGEAADDRRGGARGVGMKCRCVGWAKVAKASPSERSAYSAVPTCSAAVGTAEATLCHYWNYLGRLCPPYS
jgi:hypothetical protein